MRELVVGISGINAGDNPGPGAGIARSLKEDAGLNVRVVGLAYDALEPGIYMDWLFDQAYTLPYPSSGGAQFLERLREIQAESGLERQVARDRNDDRRRGARDVRRRLRRGVARRLR